MIPQFTPKSLQGLASSLPKAKPQRRLTTEEKVKLIKKKFGLSHGKGKSRKKYKGKEMK